MRRKQSTMMMCVEFRTIKELLLTVESRFFFFLCNLSSLCFPVIDD